MREYTYSEVMRECNKLITEGNRNRINLIRLQKCDGNRYVAQVIRGGIWEEQIKPSDKGYNAVREAVLDKFLIQLPPNSYLHYWRDKKYRIVAYIQTFLPGSIYVCP